MSLGSVILCFRGWIVMLLGMLVRKFLFLFLFLFLFFFWFDFFFAFLISFGGNSVCLFGVLASL